MYTQGMNEVLAVIYYCFVGPYLATDTKTELADFNDFSPNKDSEMDAIEADLFCAFSNIMVDLRDMFLRELDHERSGLDGHIQDYVLILSSTDDQLYSIIEENQVPHQFYCMKWFMLLMCQEFNITDSLRLWDTLLSAEGDLPGKFKSKISRFSFINYVAVALVR